MIKIDQNGITLSGEFETLCAEVTVVLRHIYNTSKDMFGECNADVLLRNIVREVVDGTGFNKAQYNADVEEWEKTRGETDD